MELALFVYLAEVSSSLKALLIGVTAGVTIFYIFYLLFYSLNHETLPKITAKVIAGIIAPAILCVAIPRKETMYLMAAGYAAQAAATSDEASKIRQLINLKLDELLKEAK